MSKLKVFISYSRKDKTYVDELSAHLSGLVRNGLIEEWNDNEIMPGAIWEDKIKQQLETSDLIIFLVSSDFMASDFINDIEIKKAIERHKNREVIIVPIIIRPCDFQSLPISKFQALPKDAKPVSKWEDVDEAWLDIVISLKKVAEAINGGKIELKPKSNLNEKSYNFDKNEEEQIKNKIAKGKIEEAIADLIKITKARDNDLYNSAILLSSRYNSYKRNVTKGLISAQDADFTKNWVANASLSIIDELKANAQ